MVNQKVKINTDYLFLRDNNEPPVIILQLYHALQKVKQFYQIPQNKTKKISLFCTYNVV